MPPYYGLAIEDVAGWAKEHLEWSGDAAQLGAELAEALIRAGAYPGDNRFNIGAILARIRDQLRWCGDNKAEASSTSQIRPVVELCNDQWAITDYGIEARDHQFSMSFGKAADLRVSRAEHEPHVDREQWDEALRIARAIHERIMDEPPF